MLKLLRPFLLLSCLYVMIGGDVVVWASDLTFAILAQPPSFDIGLARNLPWSSSVVSSRQSLNRPEVASTIEPMAHRNRTNAFFLLLWLAANFKTWQCEPRTLQIFDQRRDVASSKRVRGVTFILNQCLYSPKTSLGDNAIRKMKTSLA